MRRFWDYLKIVLAAVGLLLVATRARGQESPAQAKLPQISAVQAIFEEATELSEVLPPPLKLIFVGADAHPVFQALQALAALDSMSPPAFALSGRIFWVANNQAFEAMTLTLETPAVQILSSSDARLNGLAGENVGERDQSKIWILNLSANDGDSVRERYLESADRPWNLVSALEIADFAKDSKALKFFALKRRIWRHVLLMYKNGTPSEALEVLKQLAADPTIDETRKKGVQIMFQDLREIVARYYPQNLSELELFLMSQCQTALL